MLTLTPGVELQSMPAGSPAGILCGEGAQLAPVFYDWEKRTKGGARVAVDRRYLLGEEADPRGS